MPKFAPTIVIREQVVVLPTRHRLYVLILTRALTLALNLILRFQAIALLVEDQCMIHATGCKKSKRPPALVQLNVPTEIRFVRGLRRAILPVEGIIVNENPKKRGLRGEVDGKKR